MNGVRREFGQPARAEGEALPPSPFAQPAGMLTTEELAARWRCTTFTISHKWRELGLRPLKMGRRNLFPITQIEAVEKRLTAVG